MHYYSFFLGYNSYVILHKQAQQLELAYVILCYIKLASLAEARNMTEAPFGGLNIFVRDFVQLKPVFGSPLYSQTTVRTSIEAAMSVRSQQSAIGKAL